MANALAGLAGAALTLWMLWDIFQVMVLTRRATRQFQLTRGLVRAFRYLYSALARRVQDISRREDYLSISAPLFVFVRFGVWALTLVVGFALMQWAAGSQVEAPPGAAPFDDVLYFSGTTFFSVALGDATPATWLPRALNVLEAATGLGFLGLIIGYLPVFYQDYARREARLSMLDEWAGSPPCAGELLRRLGQDRALDTLDPFLREWEEWCAELLESHLSYPILAFYRSQHENQSWVSALATILDTCALVHVGIDGIHPRAAHLAFAMARHAAVDLTQTVGMAPSEPAADRLPPTDWQRLGALLRENAVPLREGADAEARLRELRAQYEPYLNALSAVLLMPLPNWLPGPEPRDNWQKTAGDANSPALH